MILILGQGPPPPPSGKYSLLLWAKLSGIDKLLSTGKEVTKCKRSKLILQTGLWKQHSDFFLFNQSTKSTEISTVF